MRKDLQSWTSFLKKGNRKQRWVNSDPFVLEHDASKGGFGFLLTAVPRGFDVLKLPPHLRPGQAFAGYYSPEDFSEITFHTVGGDAGYQHGDVRSFHEEFIGPSQDGQFGGRTLSADSRHRARLFLSCCAAYSLLALI